MKHIYFDQIDSTNKYLKDNYLSLDDFTFVSSFNQTKGRGRLTHNWVDPKGKGIALSILIKNDKLMNINDSFPLFIASIIHKVLINLYQLPIKIKWPNDLLFNKKKLCGILIESIVSNKIDALIIGIGINCNQHEFPIDIASTAISLSQILNHDISMNDLLDQLIKELDKDINQLLNNNLSYNYIDYVRNNLYGLDEIIEYQKDNEFLKGRIKDLDHDGLLIIESNKQIIKVRSGEIKIRL